MAVLVLLTLLVQAGIRAEMSTAEPQPSSVPVPTNVRIESYDMNAVVYWDYPSMPQTPLFTVLSKCYGTREWISACSNTSDHQCCISNIDDPSLPVWAKVMARVGPNESAFIESRDFVMCEHGKVGPPEVTVTREEDHIIIDVVHPLVHLNEEEQETMYDADHACYIFDYNVYVTVNRSETLKYGLAGSECLYTPCRLRIPVPSLNSEYCISAEGVSESWDVTTVRSEEDCITIHSSSIKDSVWIPIVAALLLFLAFILIFACCYFKKNPCKRKNIMLPKSLLSVVKNATSETKPESKYVSFISSYQPITVENETVIVEEVSPVAVPGASAGDGRGRGELGGGPAAQVGTVTLDESAPALTEDASVASSNQTEPCSVILNSYHSRNGSDCGLVGSNSFTSDSEIPQSSKLEMKTERQESFVPRNAPTSFGYDKPHVLVDLLVGDGGDKESLVGYRLTTDSREFSCMTEMQLPRGV